MVAQAERLENNVVKCLMKISLDCKIFSSPKMTMIGATNRFFFTNFMADFSLT